MGNSLQVKVQPGKDKPGSFTVTPYGSIDSDTYMDFNDKIKPILVSSTKAILLDLANVDYISSAGLGVLFTMKKHLIAQGGDLVFSNLKPQIKRLFEIVNALPKETVFQSTEEADAYLYRMMQKAIEKEGEKK